MDEENLAEVFGVDTRLLLVRECKEGASSFRMSAGASSGVRVPLDVPLLSRLLEKCSGEDESTVLVGVGSSALLLCIIGRIKAVMCLKAGTSRQLRY